MLSEAEIRSLEGQIGSAVRDDQRHHENLQSLLQQFQSLLQSYNGLKSDYEEEKANREKWKNLAKGQERNPFVLVLVDGDGYLFKEHLVKAGSEGGVTAAQLMSESIRSLLQERLPDQANQCRVMVRIYSNLQALSKTLARAGLAGHEARSLSTFTSNFTRSQDLFDFIDAGDKKEGADFKIRGQQLSRTHEDTPSQTLSTLRHYANYLPSTDWMAEIKLIPVNKDGDRLDTYCPMPAKGAWETYNRRIKQHKLCNKLHLGGECNDLSCEFDHSTSDVDPACLAVMRYMMRQRPCPRGPKCRSIKCYFGHMCQKEGCKCIKWSKFGRDTHTIDITVTHWLAPVEHDDQSETTVSEGNSGVKLMEFERLPDSSGEEVEVNLVPKRTVL
ncbi:hypothetical protein CDV55_103233 [Aspergillus turcosus]|nr:hypothetical protein CDV55_103233 [Aspergillus turcosus]